MTVHLFEILAPAIGVCALISMFRGMKLREAFAAAVMLLLVAAVFTALGCWIDHRYHQVNDPPPGWQPYSCGTHCDIPLLGPR